MKALEDIIVLDLTRVLAGPYCTAMLADYGAKVVKLEIPGKGDDTRSMGPFKNGESMYYANVNRGKLGCTLNLKVPEGKQMFLDMVKKADVVVENYRPGVMDKLGVGYDVLKEVNPASSMPRFPGSAATAHIISGRAMTLSRRQPAAL